MAHKPGHYRWNDESSQLIYQEDEALFEVDTPFGVPGGAVGPPEKRERLFELVDRSGRPLGQDHFQEAYARFGEYDTPTGVRVGAYHGHWTESPEYETPSVKRYWDYLHERLSEAKASPHMVDPPYGPQVDAAAYWQNQIDRFHPGRSLHAAETNSATLDGKDVGLHNPAGESPDAYSQRLLQQAERTQQNTQRVHRSEDVHSQVRDNADLRELLQKAVTAGIHDITAFTKDYGVRQSSDLQKDWRRIHGSWATHYGEPFGPSHFAVLKEYFNELHTLDWQNQPHNKEIIEQKRKAWELAGGNPEDFDEQQALLEHIKHQRWLESDEGKEQAALELERFEEEEAAAQTQQFDAREQIDQFEKSRTTQYQISVNEDYTGSTPDKTKIANRLKKQAKKRGYDSTDIHGIYVQVLRLYGVGGRRHNQRWSAEDTSRIVFHQVNRRLIRLKANTYKRSIDGGTNFLDYAVLPENHDYFYNEAIKSKVDTDGAYSQLEKNSDAYDNDRAELRSLLNKYHHFVHANYTAADGRQITTQWEKDNIEPVRGLTLREGKKVGEPGAPTLEEYQRMQELTERTNTQKQRMRSRHDDLIIKAYENKDFGLIGRLEYLEVQRNAADWRSQFRYIYNAIPSKYKKQHNLPSRYYQMSPKQLERAMQELQANYTKDEVERYMASSVFGAKSLATKESFWNVLRGVNDQGQDLFSFFFGSLAAPAKESIPQDEREYGGPTTRANPLATAAFDVIRNEQDKRTHATRNLSQSIINEVIKKEFGEEGAALANDFTGAISSLIFMIGGGRLSGIFTKSPKVQYTAGMAGMAMSVGEESRRRAIYEGLPRDTANAKALIDSFAEVAPTAVGVAIGKAGWAKWMAPHDSANQLKIIKGLFSARRAAVNKFVTEYGKQFGPELVQELATGVIQSGNDWLYGINPEGLSIPELADMAYHTTMATCFGTAMSAGLTGVQQGFAQDQFNRHAEKIRSHAIKALNPDGTFNHAYAAEFLYKFDPKAVDEYINDPSRNNLRRLLGGDAEGVLAAEGKRGSSKETRGRLARELQHAVDLMDPTSDASKKEQAENQALLEDNKGFNLPPAPLHDRRPKKVVTVLTPDGPKQIAVEQKDNEDLTQEEAEAEVQRRIDNGSLGKQNPIFDPGVAPEGDLDLDPLVSVVPREESAPLEAADPEVQAIDDQISELEDQRDAIDEAAMSGDALIGSKGAVDPTAETDRINQEISNLQQQRETLLSGEPEVDLETPDLTDPEAPDFEPLEPDAIRPDESIPVYEDLDAAPTDVLYEDSEVDEEVATPVPPPPVEPPPAVQEQPAEPVQQFGWRVRGVTEAGAEVDQVFFGETEQEAVTAAREQGVWAEKATKTKETRTVSPADIKFGEPELSEDGNYYFDEESEAWQPTEDAAKTMEDQGYSWDSEANTFVADVADAPGSPTDFYGTDARQWTPEQQQEKRDEAFQQWQDEPGNEDAQIIELDESDPDAVRVRDFARLFGLDIVFATGTTSNGMAIGTLDSDGNRVGSGVIVLNADMRGDALFEVAAHELAHGTGLDLEDMGAKGWEAATEQELEDIWNEHLDSLDPQSRALEEAAAARDPSFARREATARYIGKFFRSETFRNEVMNTRPSFVRKIVEFFNIFKPKMSADQRRIMGAIKRKLNEQGFDTREGMQGVEPGRKPIQRKSEFQRDLEGKTLPELTELAKELDLKVAGRSAEALRQDIAAKQAELSASDGMAPTVEEADANAQQQAQNLSPEEISKRREQADQAAAKVGDDLRGAGLLSRRAIPTEAAPLRSRRAKIAVAPIRTDNLKKDELKSPEVKKRAASAKFKHMQQVLNDVSDAFGVSVLSRQPIIGGWNEDGDGVDYEVPEIVEFDTEDVDLAYDLATIVAASAPEVQNSAMVRIDDPEGSSSQTDIKVKSAKAAGVFAEGLYDAGFKGFSYDPKTRQFTICLKDTETELYDALIEYISNEKAGGNIAAKESPSTKPIRLEFAGEDGTKDSYKGALERIRKQYAGHPNEQAISDIISRAERRLARNADAQKIRKKAEVAIATLSVPRNSADAVIKDVGDKKFKVIRDFAKWIDSRFERLHKRKMFDYGSIQQGIEGDPKGKEIAATALTYDVLSSLSKDGSGMGWYDERVQETFKELSTVYPEIANDPLAISVYIGILSITSQDTPVVANFENADRVYETYKKTGKIPSDLNIYGKSVLAINGNLKFMQDMIDQYGIEGFANFMDSEISGMELRDQYGLKAQKVNLDDVVKGNTVLGPKIGSFFNNIRGNFDTVTMDLWFTRTMHRYLGQTRADFDGPRTQKALTDFVSLLKSGERKYGIDVDSLVTDEDIVRAAMTVFYQWGAGKSEYSDKGYEKYAGGYALEKRARDINVLTGMKGAPQNKSETKYFVSIVHEAQKQLKALGFDLTAADVQAVVWYKEKELFVASGVADNKSKPADYLDAVMSLRRDKEIAASPERAPLLSRRPQSKKLVENAQKLADTVIERIDTGMTMQEAMEQAMAAAVVDLSTVSQDPKRYEQYVTLRNLTEGFVLNRHKQSHATSPSMQSSDEVSATLEFAGTRAAMEAVQEAMDNEVSGLPALKQLEEMALEALSGVSSMAQLVSMVDVLLKDFKKHHRPLKDFEQAAVILAMNYRMAHLNQLGAQLNAAIESGNSEQAADLATQIGNLEGNITDMTLDNIAAGTEAGRSLVSRKLGATFATIKMDIASMLNRAVASKKSKLTGDERNSLLDMHQEHSRLEKEIEEMRQKAEELQAESLLNSKSRKRRTTRRPGRPQQESINDFELASKLEELAKNRAC